MRAERIARRMSLKKSHKALMAEKQALMSIFAKTIQQERDLAFKQGVASVDGRQQEQRIPALYEGGVVAVSPGGKYENHQ